MSEGDWAKASAPGGTPKIDSIFDFSAEALGQLKVWLEQSGLNLPISNIVGFQQFTVQQATSILTAETTASDTYTNLATTGPTITGLPDGKYAVFYGAFGHNSTVGGGAVMSVKLNSAEAIDADALSVFPASSIAYPAGGVAASRVIFTTLANGGNNTLLARYRRGNAIGTAQYSTRWMAALRYANP